MQQAVNMRRFRPAEDVLAVAEARPGTVTKHDPHAASVSIYTIPPSLCSQRVRMTLIEKGIPCVEHVVDTARGENLEPNYIRMNPRALVPTLTVNGRVVFDSATIMRFIDNWFDGPELAPSEPAAFEAMTEWMRRSDEFPIRGFTYRAHLASGLPDYWRVGMHDNIVRARDRFPEFRATYDLKLADWRDLVAWLENPDDAAEGEAIATMLADDVEAALGRHRFLTGDSLTLGDISIFILLIRLQCGCGMTLWGPALRPRLRAFVEALKQRPSYDGAVLAPYRTSRLVAVSGDCWLPADRLAA